jgi:hypothetical protein
MSLWLGALLLNCLLHGGISSQVSNTRDKISVKNLIASLDVEEKARAKDKIEKGNEEKSSAHFVQRNHGKNNGKA